MQERVRFNKATSSYDARAIEQIIRRVETVMDKKQDLEEILNGYISQIDNDIAATDVAVADLITKMGATDANLTLANLKAEVRALINASNKSKAEHRNYRTAFVWIRDNYTKL